MSSRHCTFACAALAMLFCAPSHAAIIRANFDGTPPRDVKSNLAAYLQVDQTVDGDYMLVDVLAADEPSAWVLAREHRYYIKRTTPSMKIWAVDTGMPQWRQTVHDIDLTPYSALPSLSLNIGIASASGGVKSRTYTLNGVPLTISGPVPEPSSALLGLVAVGGLAALRRR